MSASPNSGFSSPDVLAMFNQTMLELTLSSEELGPPATPPRAPMDDSTKELRRAQAQADRYAKAAADRAAALERRGLIDTIHPYLRPPIAYLIIKSNSLSNRHIQALLAMINAIPSDSPHQARLIHQFITVMMPESVQDALRGSILQCLTPAAMATFVATLTVEDVEQALSQNFSRENSALHHIRCQRQLVREITNLLHPNKKQQVNNSKILTEDELQDIHQRAQDVVTAIRAKQAADREAAHATADAARAKEQATVLNKTAASIAAVLMRPYVDAENRLSGDALAEACATTARTANNITDFLDDKTHDDYRVIEFVAKMDSLDTDRLVAKVKEALRAYY